jgi:alpha-galactosidase
MKAIVESNPDVMFEGCASGGNRFDLGILCYMVQIWTSDDTDCYERMKIQTGTSYGYPQSVMGCHVSACPNHQTTRSSPIEARFDVAAFGMLGYELDLNTLTPAEEKVVQKQVAFYKEHRALFQYGDFYRLRSPFREEFCSWILVSPDKREAIVLDAIGRMTPNSEASPIRLVGLDPELCYDVCVRPEALDLREFGSLINHVLPVKVNSQGLLMHVVSDHYMLPTEQEQFRAWGDCLMEAGLRRKQSFTGTGYNQDIRMMPDYAARLYYLKAVE